MRGYHQRLPISVIVLAFLYLEISYQLCPVHPGCTCSAKQNSFIECENVFQGVVDGFSPSDIHFPQLTLTGREITGIEDGALRGVRIIRLLVHSTEISTFGCGAFEGLQTSLVSLLLYNNTQMTDFPACALNVLVNLTHLSLDRNTIRALRNQDFQNLTRLEKLNLQSNAIDVIEPMAFSGLTNLKELYLKRNNISDIECVIFRDLTNLRSLTLSYNRITTIGPGCFDSLRKVDSISLRYNAIEELPVMRFRQNIEVEFLDISNNKISSLPKDLFKGLYKLQTFYADNNRLVSIHETLIFRDSPNLRTLSLSHNNLGPRFQYGPTKPRSMMLVDLTSNKLAEIQDLSNALADSIIEELYLSDNPLKCDCSTAWMRNPSINEKIDLARCQNPPEAEMYLIQCYPVDKCGLGDNFLTTEKGTLCKDDANIRFRNLTSTRTERNVFLRWSVFGPGAVMSFRLTYTDQLTMETGREKLVHPDERTAVLTDLHPGHMYNVCISAQLHQEISSYQVCILVAVKNQHTKDATAEPNAPTDQICINVTGTNEDTKNSATIDAKTIAFIAALCVSVAINITLLACLLLRRPSSGNSQRQDPSVTVNEHSYDTLHSKRESVYQSVE